MTHVWLFVSILLFATPPLFSQSKATAGKSTRDYRVQTLYRAGVAQSYLITQRDTVTRIHSDTATKRFYTRDVTYYATFRCIESMDNVATVVATLDSLEYVFSSEGKDVIYKSQLDMAPKPFLDLNNYMGLMNRSAEITYNPYGEITKLGGEQLEWIRDYLRESGEALDSVTALVWNQSVDDPNVLMYCDLQKRVVPGKRVAIDSSWNHELRLRIDGVSFVGEVTSTLADYTGGLFTIRTADTVSATPGQDIHVYGITDISRLIDGTAITNNELDISTVGTINSATTRILANYRARIKQEVFTHTVRSTTTWKLLGQYQW
jgi:hypothetical protein